MEINWSTLPCLVILTPNNEERRNHIESQCNLVGLNPIYIEAIMIKENPHLGCTLSHKKCIEYAKKMNYEKVLILEDDVIFKGKLPKTINKDFGIYYLGYNVTNGYRYDKNTLKFNGVFCTHSYILHSKLYDEILKDLNSNWWDKINNLNEYEKKFNWNLHTIDQYYSKILSQKTNSYGLYPMICYQKPSYSNIEKQMVDYSKSMTMNMDISSKMYRLITMFNPNKNHKKLIKKLKKYFKIFIYYEDDSKKIFNDNTIENIEEFEFKDFIDIHCEYFICFNQIDYFINLHTSSNNTILYIDDMKNITKKHKEGKPMFYNLSKIIDKIYVFNNDIYNKLINEYQIDQIKIIKNYNSEKDPNRFIIDYTNYEDFLEKYFEIKSEVNNVTMEVVKFKNITEKEINEKMNIATYYIKTVNDNKWEEYAKKNKLIILNKDIDNKKIIKLLSIQKQSIVNDIIG